ncbi:MAG: hypothetical protein ACMG6S_14045 [Byssovorax sp.]
MTYRPPVGHDAVQLQEAGEDLVPGVLGPGEADASIVFPSPTSSAMKRFTRGSARAFRSGSSG